METDIISRISAYLTDRPADGGHSDAAGGNCWELLEEAYDEIKTLNAEFRLRGQPPEGHSRYQMNDEDIETIQLLINDWGFEYGLTAQREKVIELARKLGLEDIATRFE